MISNKFYIPSIDAKDIYLASHCNYSELKEYSLKLKNRDYNLRKFINSYDDSLDLIELLDIYTKKYRRNDIVFKVKKNRYSVKFVKNAIVIPIYFV